MDTPSPLDPGKVAAPQSPGLTSHTLHAAGGSEEVDFDQTVRIKTPGSGMTVFSRYKLERVLGRGGMGVVWLADDLKLERPVALKFLPSLIGLDPAAVKELKTETRRGLELSHPHIVRIYDFVDDEDAAAISMEFVDGKTLSELRMGTEHGVFSVDEVSRWLLGVCDALDYAHFQRKLIHRDLKPANIMLTTKDSVAKIADFGIARSLSDTMSRLSAAHIGTSGTLPYMSPQQAMGERPQPTDDVYSLGATLYELLSGKPPFYRGDLSTQINSKIPPSVQERRQELEISAKEPVPKLWEEAIAACLHKDPAMRPTCAGVLAEMLGLKPATVTVRTGTYAAAAARSTSQKARSNAPLLAAAAALVVGGGAAAYFMLQPGKTAAPTVAAVPAKGGEPAKKAPATETQDSKSLPKKADKSDKKSGAESGTTAVADKKSGAADSDTPPASAPAPKSTSGDATPTVAATPGIGSGDSPAPIPAGSAQSSAGDAGTGTTASAPASPPESLPLTGPGTGPMTPVISGPAGVLPGSLPPASPAGLTPAPGTGTLAGSPLSPTGSLTGTVPLAPGTGVGSLPLEMDPNSATQAALAGTIGQPAPGSRPIMTTPPPLPPGYTPPAEGLVLTQPNVPEPADGFWTVQQIFPVLPQANYSEKGKHYLLYRTQSALKEKGLYTATLDGEHGKGTHNAIILFQVRTGLEPNGLLDLPTLAALNLSAEPDKTDWSAPSSGSSGGGSRRRTSQPKEEPGFFQKTGDTFKKLFK